MTRLGRNVCERKTPFEVSLHRLFNIKNIIIFYYKQKYSIKLTKIFMTFTCVHACCAGRGNLERENCAQAKRGSVRNRLVATN